MLYQCFFFLNVGMYTHVAGKTGLGINLRNNVAELLEASECPCPGLWLGCHLLRKTTCHVSGVAVAAVASVFPCSLPS